MHLSWVILLDQNNTMQLIRSLLLSGFTLLAIYLFSSTHTLYRVDVSTACCVFHQFAFSSSIYAFASRLVCLGHYPAWCPSGNFSLMKGIKNSYIHIDWCIHDLIENAYLCCPMHGNSGLHMDLNCVLCHRLVVRLLAHFDPNRSCMPHKLYCALISPDHVFEGVLFSNTMFS